MPGSPRPQYFVARVDGTLTPMIAVDELPSSLRIEGVPSTITPAGTQNMTSLGLKERSSQRYIVLPVGESPVTGKVETMPTANEKQAIGDAQVHGTEAPKSPNVELVKKVEDVSKVPESQVVNQVQATEAYEHGVVEPKVKVNEMEINGSQKAEHKQNEEKSKEQKVEESTSSAVDSWRKKVHENAPMNGNHPATEISREKLNDKDDEAASAGTASKSSHESPSKDNLPSKAAYGGMGTRGTLGKKIYCTHWIRWGECDYTQQGCLYKHEMPDEAKLQEIGIATYPRWYRIANPEKFNGVTDGPEWHRRPGPAPTDQLWRGPPPARPVEPQSYEEFRSNARPAPSPVHRQPIGPPTNHTTGPVLFAFDPNANTFHSFGGFGNFHGGYIQQAPRQTLGRTPMPRVVSMQSPFIRQQRSGYSGNTTNANDCMPTAAPGSTQSFAKVTEISEETPTELRTEPSKQQSAGKQAELASPTAESSPTKNGISQTATRGVEFAAPTAPFMAQANPTSGQYNSFSHVNTNGNHATANRGRQQSHSQPSQGLQNVNKVYQPLVPTAAPAQNHLGNGHIPDSSTHHRVVPAPQTPPAQYKRYFNPPSQPLYPRNGSAAESSKKGNMVNGRQGDSLVDL